MTRSTQAEHHANARTAKAKRRPFLAVRQRLAGGADPRALLPSIFVQLSAEEFDRFEGPRTGRKLARLVAQTEAGTA